MPEQRRVRAGCGARSGTGKGSNWGIRRIPTHEENAMRIATFEWKGLRHVGIVDADGQHLRPLQLASGQARLGALAVIEEIAASGQWPT